jgi:3-deoxy-D-manno-octulosonate 8-phosphate phosphatase (KDO 8-P phosphatase)
MSARSIPTALRQKLAAIRLLLCDVDGVLTDGTVFIGGEEEIKQFNIQDGLGIVIARKQGLKIGWISSRPSSATRKRATELKIDYLEEGPEPKVIVIERLLSRTGMAWPEACYLGDDIVDLGPLKRAAVAIAVANGVSEARAAADYVTSAAGGRGAVREVIEMILKAQGKWDVVVNGYAS